MNRSTQYKQLCKIEFKHSYYANNVMRDFNLNIPDSARVGSGQNLVVKQIENTLVIYSPQNDQGIPTKMHFPFDSQNPHFLAFTEIPLKNNTDDNWIQISGEKRHLFSNLDAIGGTIPKKECVLVGTSFELKFQVKEEGAKKVELLDAEGNLVYEEKIETAEAETGQWKTHFIDVTQSVDSSGTYQLVFNGKETVALFITPSIQEYNGIGILEIHPSKDANYSIQLDSRSVYFQYNIIPMDSEKEYAFKIKANDGQAVVYEQQEDKKLPNGQVTTPILLKEKIALAERPTRTFLLEIEESGKNMSINLPFADGFSLKRLENNIQGEAYIAEMYIYL